MLSTLIPRKNCLIVLLPEGTAGNLDLAQQLYQAALQSQANIFLLAVVDHRGTQPAVSYGLAAMKALLSDDTVETQARITDGDHWRAELGEVYQPGSQILCQAEQPVNHGEGQLRPWVRALLLWLGFLVILAIFTGMEIQIDQMLEGFPQNLFLGLLVTLEFFAILVWDTWNR